MSTCFLTAAEVASMLGVPQSWVYEQSLRGRIPTAALGRYRRFREEAIARMVEQLEHQAARPGA
jgi:excisionase family DNA binding protein